MSYEFNMVDMGGIDIATVNGTVVEGLYNKLLEGMDACGNLILYNWKFAEIEIVPSACSVLIEDEAIIVNGTIRVSSEDVVSLIWADPPPVPVEPITITENGVYTAQEPLSGYNPVSVNVPIPRPRLIPITILENGTYNPPSGVDGYAPVTVNVSGGIDIKGFEVYAADCNGGGRNNFGILNNNYFACFFDDNMSSDYTLNGNSASFSVQTVGETGSTGMKATTVAVTNASQPVVNAIILNDGSIFSTSHYDGGSYISVVGGWVGYPSGGDIYEQGAKGTINSITMDKIYDTLLLFIGATLRGTPITSIDINGVTYQITNNGTKYDNVYGSYTAIEINNLNASAITVTFPTSCYNYVSIIGIDR